MRDHTSLAQCKIEMKIVGLLRIQSISCFWFLLNQGKLSILCSRIQDCMLSLMKKIDPCVASLLVMHEMENYVFEHLKLIFLVGSLH